MLTVPNLATTDTPTVSDAPLHGEPGSAILTPSRQVLFADYDATFYALTNGDAPAVTLLGAVTMAEKQHVLDTLAGGPALIACSRAN